MKRLPSVQQLHTRLRAIADDTLYLADGRPRAIFEVFPVDLSLADDDTLEVHTARLAAFLHGLSFPIQVLLRLVRADLEAHAREVEQVSAARGSHLAAAGREYAGLVRHLERTASLLEPHLYVVVGLEGSQGSLVRRLLSFLLPSLAGRSAEQAADTALLDERAAQIAVGLDAAGADPVRLENPDIAQLVFDCWCPERARREPVPLAEVA
jgi:hypothetical protein